MQEHPQQQATHEATEKGGVMTRPEYVSFVIAANCGAFWFPATSKLVCVPCFNATRVKPISYWPLCDEWINALVGFDQRFQFCSVCAKELGTTEEKEVKHVH